MTTPAFHYEFWLRENGGFYFSTTWFLYYFWPGEHQAYTYIHSSSLLKLADIQGFGRCSQCPSWTNFALCRAVSWFFKLFFLIPECGDKKTWFSLFQKPVLYHTSTKKTEMNKQLRIKNSLELSASFIKKRFHVSISYSPTTFCWTCVFAVKTTKMWGSSTLQTWTTLGILPWPSCGIFFRSLP